MSRAPPMRVDASAPVSASRRRISENPFECGPDERKPDDDVAGARAPPVDDAVAFDDADAESREVIVAVGVHAGHLGGFAADQGAARLHAALGDAGDDPLGDVHRKAPGRVVVEEEEGLRALDHDVVRAHGDEVLADAVVQAGVDREPELGADAVGAGDQDRPPPAALRDFDHGAESADAGQHLRPLRPRHARLDALDEFLAGIDVDAGIPVGQRGAFSHQCTIVA